MNVVVVECCSAVSTTPAINPCHGFSVIAGVVDTGDKFITGVIVTGDQFITGEQFIASDNDKFIMTAINLLSVTRSRMPWRWGAAKEKIEGDKSVISLAAEDNHSCRWCHWKRHEKLHP